MRKGRGTEVPVFSPLSWWKSGKEERKEEK